MNRQTPEGVRQASGGFEGGGGEGVANKPANILRNDLRRQQ